MEKRPSLVIIDTDYSYLKLIEDKIISRYAGKTRLQLITEPEYVSEFFKYPKQVDVLVIDQASYGDFLEKQRVRKTFLVLDEVDVGKAVPKDVSVLMKYMPSDEICQRIDEALDSGSGSEEEDRPAETAPARETKVIAVYSPIGGSGKSLVTLALARKLKKLDQQVLILGCDTMQTLSVYFPGEKYAQEELVDELKTPGEDTYWTILQNVESGEVSYLRPFEKPLSALQMGAAEWKNMIGILKEKKDFDFLLLDIGTYLNREAKTLLDMSDMVVLLTESNEIANRKMQKLQKTAEFLPACECFLIANEYHNDGLRINPDVIFGKIMPYESWQEAMEDPVFYRIALKATE